MAEGKSSKTKTKVKKMETDGSEGPKPEEAVPKTTAKVVPKASKEENPLSDLDKVQLFHIDRGLNENAQNSEPEIDILSWVTGHLIETNREFKGIKKTQNAVDAAVLQLGGTESKDWGDYVQNVIELFQASTNYAYLSWGKSANKESVSRFAKGGVDWSARSMGELIYSLLSKTVGLNWKEVLDSVATIQTLRGEVSRVRAEFAQTVGDEWARGMGSTIQDFAIDWQNFRAKMVEMELKIEELQQKTQVRSTILKRSSKIKGQIINWIKNKKIMSRLS